MAISPEEQADVDALKAKHIKIKLSAFDMMHEFTRMSPESLVHTGHKTVEAALLYTMKEALKSVKKEGADFIKKWPDC